MSVANSLKSFALPEIHSLLLPNGGTLYAVPWRELPLVNIDLVIPSGAEADPPGKGGLADLTAEMLTLGTQKRSANQLAADVDGLGATLAAYSGWNATVLHVLGLNEDFDRLMELIREVTLEAAFAPEEFELLKKRRIATLVQQKDESQIVADERFQEILFQDTPYDHPVHGTLKSLPPLSCREARESFPLGSLPPGSFFVIVGDIQPETGWRWVETHFPFAEKGEKTPRQVTFPASRSHFKTFMVDRPDLTQSQIRLGHISLPHAHPDFVPFGAMNYILGAGGFSSRLMQKIRSQLGYTYGIHSSLEPRLHPGPFKISTFTPTDLTAACLREVFEVLRIFIDQGATAAEREEAIRFLIGSYPAKFETPGQIAQKIIQAKLHGLGMEYLAIYPDLVSDVTPEMIAHAARAYIHPEAMIAVIVGRAENFRRDFESFGPVEVME